MFRIAILLLLMTSLTLAADAVDVVRFGVADSEAAHGFKAVRAEVIEGGLDQPARQLLPLEPAGEYGGNVKFELKVDGQKPNYLTVKFWGSDAGEDRGRLLLFAEGKQVGLRHLGDVDVLDVLANEPRFPGRFVYKTLPLPTTMTAGKQSIQLEIRALGRIWGYGETWDKFQKLMNQPSRGIYAAYCHTDPHFVPPAEEKQGDAVVEPAVRREPGPEVMDELKARVNREVEKMLAGSQPLNQMQIQMLAKAYHVAWTPAHHNAAAVDRVVSSIDALHAQFKEDPKLAGNDPKTWNADWFGFGPAGHAIVLLGDVLKPRLDQQLNGMTRRAAWAEMMRAARDYHRSTRRLYTNQTMIKDLYGIYLANRALVVLDPKQAMPEPEAKRYLYEAVGLQPWLGSDTPTGHEKRAGENYMQLTARGLTKELGYVGSYGEVLDWATSIYDATRPAPGEPGDEKIKAQLIKIAQARSFFRYPMIDEEGRRAMVLETVIGWRDNHYPGDVTYTQRPTRDSGPLETAAATLDPTLIAYAHQMLDENKYFASLKQQMTETSFRVTAGLMGNPDAYEVIRSQPKTGRKMPMADRDFVFSDEEDGVVAIKHGSEILYASLYWRARFGVNSLARVHYLTPTIERDATVHIDIKFDDSGMTFTQDDRTIEAQTRRHEKSKGDLQSTMEGQVLPIAKIPAGVSFKPGQESVYAGRGTFYTCRYGPYLIGMNATGDRTFDLKVPADLAAIDLSTGEPASGTIKVKPMTTVVLRAKD